MCIHTFLDLVYTNTLPSICPSFTLTRVALDKPFSFSSVSFILIVLLRPAAVGEAGEVREEGEVGEVGGEGEDIWIAKLVVTMSVSVFRISDGEARLSGLS